MRHLLLHISKIYVIARSHRQMASTITGRPSRPFGVGYVDNMTEIRPVDFVN
jgi:hypothetical protein